MKVITNFNEYTNTMVEDRIVYLYNDVFRFVDCNYLTKNEKRNIICDYLTRNIRFDFQKYEELKFCAERKIPASRNSVKEFCEALFNGYGLCHNFVQLTQLLLEKAGIFSIQGCVNDGSGVLHAIALIENENGRFSFFDVCRVAAGLKKKEECFDIGFNGLHLTGQGLEKAMNRDVYIIPPEMGVLVLAKRETTENFYNNAINKEVANNAEIVTKYIIQD